MLSKENIIPFLKTWGYNSGEFEELVILLAENNGFEDIDAELISGDICYSYILSKEGEKIAEEWAKENDYIMIPKQGNFYDQNQDSVQNTIEELEAIA